MNASASTVAIVAFTLALLGCSAGDDLSADTIVDDAGGADSGNVEPDSSADAGDATDTGNPDSDNSSGDAADTGGETDANTDTGTPVPDPAFIIAVGGIDAFDLLSNDQKTAIRDTKVFFEHMSVGENIIKGFTSPSAPWNGGTNSLGFVFRSVSSASDYSTVTLGDKAFGFNGRAIDKISMFADAMTSGGYGNAVRVAGFKFCYNDLTTENTSNVGSVIDAYRTAFATVEASVSSTSFFHVTTPLQPANEWHSVENNAIRVEFADFLRDTYSGSRHVVFDLQTIESTDASGGRCKQNDVPVLCAAWAGDRDGHLNDAGSTRAAKAFLYAIHVARGL